MLQLAEGSGAGTIQIVRRAAGNDNLELIRSVPIQHGAGAYYMALADFDKDGHADIAVAASEAKFEEDPPLKRSGSVSVFFGDGSGGFSTEFSFPAGWGPIAIESGDLNGDGWTDIAVTTVGKFFYDGTPDFGGLQVLLSDGFRGFVGPEGVATGVFPIGLALADLDGSGTLDAAVANVASSTVSILLNYVEVGAGVRGVVEDVRIAAAPPNPDGVRLASLGGVPAGAVKGKTASPPEDPTYWYHSDHLGTPQAMTDANGAVVWKADYEPFGKPTITAEQVVNNFRFPGQYEDGESGLSHNWHRQYRAKLGAYLTPDRAEIAALLAYSIRPRRGTAHGIGSAQFLSPDAVVQRRRQPYLYAGGNPLTGTDKMGLHPCSATQEIDRDPECVSFSPRNRMQFLCDSWCGLGIDCSTEDTLECTDMGGIPTMIGINVTATCSEPGCPTRTRTWFIPCSVGEPPLEPPVIP